MRVFAVLVDPATGRVGLNQKDGLLPEKVARFEGLINLFGGAIEDGETFEQALARELEEEIPGFVHSRELERARRVSEDDQFVIFAVPTDLEGHRHTRGNDRITLLMRCCMEGEAIVRTIGFVRRASNDFFIDPKIRRVIIEAYEMFAD
jgi:8-oxo-dGTP pyrophosphatase MutT (NUDIX family)